MLSYASDFLSPHQTIGSEDNQGLADFGVIQYYGWRRVTIFQLDVDTFENARETIGVVSLLTSIEVSVSPFTE